MTVKQLMAFLANMPDDATVRLDDEGYPEVDGCYLMDPKEFEGDIEDAPPENTVLLEMTRGE